MRHTTETLKSSALNTDLNELAHDFIRELAMAAKKVSIYGSNHQVAQRSLEKPFLTCSKILAFKTSVGLNLHKGNLCLINIVLKESVFTSDIIRYLQILDVTSILLDYRMSMAEFSKFVDRLVKRVSTDDHSKLLSAWLSKNKIDTVEVNTERSLDLFEKNRIYRGDVSGDFSVRGMVMQQLGDDFGRLIAISRRGAEALQDLHIDFHFNVVNYMIPEKIARFSVQQLVDSLSELARSNESESYRTVCKLLEYHPSRDKIIRDVEANLDSSGVGTDTILELANPTGAIRLEAGRKVDELTQEFFSDESSASLPAEALEQFRDSFARLLKTSQQEKAGHTICWLVDMMSAPQPAFRQKSLSLLVALIAEIKTVSDLVVIERVSDHLKNKIDSRQETFEYSELIWRFFESILVHHRFDILETLTSSMANRRSAQNGVMTYDSITIKNVFSQLNRREVLSSLIDELIRSDHALAGQLRKIFVNIGSEEVALALTDIISYPDRSVRQNALKCLSELGKPAVKVCSRILNDDTMFERDADRHELSDPRWYIIRNAIFVLGNLEDEEGINALRLRFNDTDVRVRREIVAALEKIGGEDACDLLTLMANDPAKEIKEKSIITIGLIGNHESVPLLIDLARTNPPLVRLALTAIGKLGGDDARSFLIELLENDDSLSNLAAGLFGKEDLQVVVIKALGKIGDDESISNIERFKDSIPTAKKLFFKGSALGKVISEILSRR